MTGADLSGADLSGAVLTNAVLSGVDLTGAVLTNVVTGPLVGTPTANALIVTAANAAPDSTSWIGVYHNTYDNWDEATAAAITATSGDVETSRYGKYYTWKYVNGSEDGSGQPAAADATVTFNFSRMLSGTYNVVMFEDGSESDAEVSNVLTVSVNG